MIRFPFAKINVGLNVVRKRPDGYHDIESLMVPIPLCDMLEAVVDPDLGLNEVIFTRSGMEVPGAVENDLCWRAAKALNAVRPLPGIRLHLHKIIPMGAGLGGGSSDGAHTLLLLNDLLDLGADHDQLTTIAAGLGSDCPFFLTRGPQLAQGRGEVLKPIDLDLSGTWLVLVNPGSHVSTAEVYAHTALTGSSWGDIWSEVGRTFAAMTTGSGSNDTGWSERMIPNTMEQHVFQQWPEIRGIKEKLIAQGAFHAAMSGSGSSVFGLFSSKPAPTAWPAHFRHWTFRM